MGCACTGTGTQYAQCAGVTIADPQPDSVMKMWAAQVGAPTTGANAWAACVISAFLQTRRFIYWKNAPGDCGQNTNIQLGVSGQITGIAGLAASSDPEPLSKAVLTGIAQVFGIFTASHAKAVGLEQSTLCDVANAYNQNAFALEKLVQAGQYTPAQASAALAQIVAQLQASLQTIQNPCTSGKFNAACGYKFGLDALLAYNQSVVYPSIYRAPAAVVTPSAGTPGSGGVIVSQNPGNVSGQAPLMSVPGAVAAPDLTSQLTAAVNTGQISPTLIGLLAAAGLVIVFLA